MFGFTWSISITKKVVTYSHQNLFFGWGGYIRCLLCSLLLWPEYLEFSPKPSSTSPTEKTHGNFAEKNTETNCSDFGVVQPFIGSKKNQKTKLFCLGKISGWMMRTSNISTWISFLIIFSKVAYIVTIRFAFHLTNHRLPGVFCFRSQADICP